MTGTKAGFALIVVAACVSLAAVLTGGVPLPGILALPPAALLAVVLILASLPILLMRWSLALGVFFCWLMVEDLVRKLAGNDLKVYFVKDLIYVVAMIALLVSPAARGVWMRATGRARFALYALIAWGVVMSVPTVMQDWRLPLLGLRFDFFYAPLVVAGYLVARESESLRRWLLALACLGALASSIGVAQAIIGPQFLAPEQPTPGLINLVTVRELPETGPVYRPTGPFVDPGRYAVMAATTVAAALAATLLSRGRARIVAWLCAAIALAGIWVSGGRALFLLGAALVVLALLAPAFAERRQAFTRAVPIAALGMVLLFMFAIFVPHLLTNRLAWYQTTLDPRSPKNEWQYRWKVYGTGTINGLKIGGPFGVGTGQESLGKPYLVGDGDSPENLYQVESGYGSVAVEWGAIGLALWLLWSIGWFIHACSSVRVARDGPLGAVGFVLAGWMFLFLFVQFFTSYGSFQNYLGNAYFWFLSGVIFALPEAHRRARERTRSPSVKQRMEPVGAPT